MELSDIIFKSIKHLVPEDKWEDVENIISKQMDNFKPSAYLKKDCINLLSINTGMMPRQKAEEYMHNIADKITKLLGEESKDYTIFYMANTAQGRGNTISHVEKGKLTIVDIDTGMLTKEKAEQHFHKSVKQFNEYKEKGYDLAFIKRDYNLKQTITKQVDN